VSVNNGNFSATKMSENRKSWIRHYILYILPITFFLIFILGLLFTNLSSYVGGVKGTPFILLSIMSFAPFFSFCDIFYIIAVYTRTYSCLC